MVYRYNKDTQEKILSEANHLFMAKGYKGTSTREIAKKVGITQPNLYYYFSDKETLYIATLERQLNTVGQALREIMIAHRDEGFKHTLIKMTQYLLETHVVNLFMMHHDMQANLTGDNKSKLFTLWKKQYREPFETIFAQYQQSLRENVSQELAAKQFFLILAAYMTQSHTTMEPPMTVETLIDLYLYGLLQS